MEATRSSAPLTPAAMENYPTLNFSGSDGAMALLHRIHSEAKPFTEVRALRLILMPGDNFDDFDDDMWSVALCAIHPGNTPHALAYVCIVIDGNILFERNAHRVTNPVGSRDADPNLKDLLSANRKISSRALEKAPLEVHYYERAVIRALCGIRGVTKVDIRGPVEPRLRQQIVDSMTSPIGTDPAPLDDDIDAALAADGLWGFLDGKNTNKSVYFNTDQPAIFDDSDDSPLSSLPSEPPSPTPSIHTGDTHIQQTAETKQPNDEDDNDDSAHTDTSSNTGSASDFEPDVRITSRKGFTTRRVTRALLTPPRASKKRKLAHKNNNSSSSLPDSAAQATSQAWQPRLAVINAQRQDIHDFGHPLTAAPATHMPWFEAKDDEQDEWLLPTGKGARVCVGKFVGKE
ncbi:uncharacterized protein K452DRAFT_293695 [Aplosporella prunicola CBS 121167]|uniref:Uncharacterized protein n=1 Tax=Aplosporella prunicola CBS 121167 TaxID=1176127 RepID=A0A6A6BVD6_9PEZI|nr:uncharacterized protein K452DRAFT_293695 [Aplosporella prunicola CBS 121167]KAF2147235.1 hypothetical protein K452DRAFT_293695 [Aplosporella prunicola CBS 121167]